MDELQSTIEDEQRAAAEELRALAGDGRDCPEDGGSGGGGVGPDPMAVD